MPSRPLIPVAPHRLWCAVIPIGRIRPDTSDHDCSALVALHRVVSIALPPPQPPSWFAEGEAAGPEPRTAEGPVARGAFVLYAATRAAAYDLGNLAAVAWRDGLVKALADYYSGGPLEDPTPEAIDARRMLIYEFARERADQMVIPVEDRAAIRRAADAAESGDDTLLDQLLDHFAKRSDLAGEEDI
jgi:hypothetical protein